ncbi:protein of unknown function [Aminobacter niigataensis]|nr:protein of unknown function [Aminobacter niigataensis]
MAEPFGLSTVESGHLKGDARMQKNMRGICAMTAAVAFAVVALLAIGLMDRARGPHLWRSFRRYAR